MIESPGTQPNKIPTTFESDVEITQNGKFVTIINNGLIEEASIAVWKPSYKINSNKVLFWELYMIRQESNKLVILSVKKCKGGRATEMNGIFLESGFENGNQPKTLSTRIVRVN